MAAVVVGLGNPVGEYGGTRHNIGQMVVDELADRGSARLKAHTKTRTLQATVRIGTVNATVAVPMSYMNLSGGPTSSLAKYVSVPPEEVIVIHDDLDLPFGTIKLKRGGGSGGHNGLKDITKALGTPDYVRVRVGIGRPPGRMDPATFVLRQFGAAERKELPFVVSDAADAVEALLTSGLEAAQQEYHSRA